MAKFNAATAVEALEYDFTAYSGGSGIIPEPTTGEVQTFFNTIRDLAQEVRNRMQTATSAEVTDADAAELMSEMTDDMVQEYQDRIINAVATLTKGQPNAEDIGKLPYRVLSAFTAWLAGALRPEQQGPATSH